MALFGHEFADLNDLFVEQLRDLYDSEKRLTGALPRMAKAASSPQLVSAIQEHEKQTEEHVRRLEQVFHRIGLEPDRKSSSSMKGLISDGESLASAKGDAKVRDAAIIAAAQHVEHYEIAGYGTVRTFAQHLGMPDVAQILQQTLNEEKEADQKLNQIAESSVNVQAV
jgi:ferritin-like metal-binding protein YciE